MSRYKINRRKALFLASSGLGFVSFAALAQKAKSNPTAPKPAAPVSDKTAVSEASVPKFTRRWPLATSPQPPISAYGKLPAIEKIAISPDGKRLAMVMDRKGERAIIDYELATGKAAAGIIANDKLRDLMWADEQRILVVSSNTEKIAGEKGEQPYGLILDLPAGKRRQLYSNIANVPTSVVTGDFFRIKKDGAFRITASGYSTPEGVNNTSGGYHLAETWEQCLYAFNPVTGNGIKLDSDAHSILAWAIKSDGALFARSEYDDDTKMWIIRIRDGKKWRAILEYKVIYDMPWMAGLGRDGNSVVVHFNSGEDSDKYFEYDAQGNRTLLELPHGGFSPIFHPETLQLAGFRNSGSVDNWVFYDEIMKQLPPLIKESLPDTMTDLVDMANDPRKVVVYADGMGEAGSYYFIDYSAGDIKKLGSKYPSVPSDWVAEKRYIEYEASDGLKIGAFLTFPPAKDGQNLPLIMLPHGGPEAYDDASFDWWSQALASQGYAVLQPNFRGSGGISNDFTAKGYGEIGRKMQTDLSDGVAYLVKSGLVDPKRVAIVGASYGGYAALAGVTLQNGIYNCAVSLAGLSDLKTFLDYRNQRGGYDNDSYSMLYWKRFMGPDLNSISPVSFVNKITVPVQLLHGLDDVVVPIDQSEQMYAAMIKAGKSVEFVKVENEDHWLSRESSRVKILESMIRFLQKYNPA